VFENYEQIDSSDLTLKTKGFEVPVDEAGSAVAGAVRSGYPVLAEARMSEFDADPFFEFIGTRCYLAVPIRSGERVLGVLAADNARSNREISVDDVSLLYSLAQQAALSVERLMENADNRRRFRILRKLQEIMRNAETRSQLGEGLNLAMSMVCRAVGASGCFLRDYVRNKTIHIKTVDEYTVDVSDDDAAVSSCFERILDRCAGGMRPLNGDNQHPLLDDTAAARVHFFHAVPMVVTGDGLGAMAVYAEKDEGETRSRLDLKNRTFLELCAGLIADRLNVEHLQTRMQRAERMLEETRANLVRERDAARLGERVLDANETISRDIAELRETIHSSLPPEARVERARELLEHVDEELADYSVEIDRMKSSLRILDLFSLVADLTRRWGPGVSERGVELTIRIPESGPALLMNRQSVTTALGSILESVGESVGEGDRVLVECTASGEKAVVLVADTGEGLPGDLLSRLFMPFGRVEEGDDRRSAMSLAGDIIHRHAGEISVRSSPSWRTILVITFPVAPNSDRRHTRRDRRRREDRRGAAVEG
jgi:signal transduction histidine kinase